MNIWAFCYTDNTWESAAATMSLHLTKKGAQEAMRQHKQKERDEYNSIWQTEQERKDFPFGQFQDWFVKEMEVLP